MQIQVGEIIVRFMEKLGIRAIFGMPGAHILPVYDSLYGSSIQSVLAKHEQGAAFMADGYARISGEIGACITTAGPGATNLVTGIANAYSDKRPVLVITGEAPTHIFGKGGLQESSGEGGSIDQGSIFKGITCYHKVIERTDYLANVLNHAAKILLSEKPGPVLLSLPYNVQKELVDESLLERVKIPAKNSGKHLDPEAINRFASLLCGSRAPVVIAGYGCILSSAQAQVQSLSEGYNIPVTSSLKGKGVISEQSALSLGSLGVTSTGYAYQYIVEKSDLVIFLGAGFNERTSYLWDEGLLKDKKVVQVDINHEQLEKVFHADIAIAGDIGSVLSALLAELEARQCKPMRLDDLSGYMQQMERQARDQSTTVFQDEFALVELFYQHLEKHFESGLTVYDDNIIFAQNFFNVAAGNHFYPNSGISSLGHAIPAAIGASFYTDDAVFAILGDGGFQMCCMEIMTAVNYKKPLNIVMFNNATMGLIRKNQHQQYQDRFIDCDFINPDYEQLAQSFGINYKKIQTEVDLTEVFNSTDFHNSINLIEIPIDKDAFPNYRSRR